MRRLLYLLFFMSTQAFAIDQAVLYKALKGNKEAIFIVAGLLSDNKSDFYSPNKAQEMFLSLAKQGDRRTFSPLATLFADPSIESYAPVRSLFYLSKLEQVSPVRLALYEFLAGKIDTSVLEIIDVNTSDDLYGIVSILKLYPFHNLSPIHLSDVKRHFKHPSVARYEPYVYPAILTPVIGETHLYGINSLADNQSWSYDELTGAYLPLRDSKGVLSILLPMSKGVKRLVVNYFPENFAKIEEYYNSFLVPTKIRNGSVYEAPGVNITVKRTSAYATVTFHYQDLPDLIQY